MIGAIDVVMAVIDTDKTVFPFESEVKKLDILPPGHDATNIIPSAIIGVIRGFNITAIRNVIAGRANHCNKTPVMIDFGFLIISFNLWGLIPRATPNITNARMMFTKNISPEPRSISPKFLRPIKISFIK